LTAFGLAAVALAPVPFAAVVLRTVRLAVAAAGSVVFPRGLRVVRFVDRFCLRGVWS
jgi:hypothetical protein